MAQYKSSCRPNVFCKYLHSAFPKRIILNVELLLWQCQSQALLKDEGDVNGIDSQSK